MKLSFSYFFAMSLSLGIVSFLSIVPAFAADDSLESLLSDLGGILSDTTAVTDTGTDDSQSILVPAIDTDNTTTFLTANTSLAGVPVTRMSTWSTLQKTKTTTTTESKSSSISTLPSAPSETIEVTTLFGNFVDDIETADHTYAITRDLKNLFFRGTWYAHATWPDRVLRITSNKHAYYIQVPLHSDGNWTVLETTTPGYILSRFLQAGSNTLTFSYFNIQKKLPETGYSSQIKLVVK